MFKEWHEKNQNDEGFFCINTETDDFKTFSTSFWRQFAYFFKSLKMWDGANDEYPQTEIIAKNANDSIACEMISTFKDIFSQYKIYEFIPKDINAVIDSLHIYSEILNGNTQLMENDNLNTDHISTQQCKKMYCKWFPDYMYFMFCAGENHEHHEHFWKLKTNEEYGLLRFNENSEYNALPTNTWLTKNF